MKVQAMVTAIKHADYRTGYFRQNEALLNKEELDASLIKGWDIAAVEGGSDTVFHFRLPATLVPKAIGNMEDIAFSPVEMDCTGASGRTWVNGQSGPVDADVTFSIVDIKVIDLKLIKDESRRRADQATTQSEEYKKQRAVLTTLEAKVKERLQTGQQAAADKK